MTKPYTVQAWCLRPFITSIEVQAASPQEAIATARLKMVRLLDAAEECNATYPWDEFAVYDYHGNEILRVLDEVARIRDEAPALLWTLDYVRATLKLRHIDEASDDEVDEALEIADKAIATVRSA